MNYLCFNGKILPATEPVLKADNRAYRYGDGVFETMKMVNGEIPLQKYHFERLLVAIHVLGFGLPDFFTPSSLRAEILAVCEKNDCTRQARIRLSVFRGHGSLYDDPGPLQYLIECWPIDGPVNELNPNGLAIDIYPDAVKSSDAFSNFKTASALPYVMAARHAAYNKLDDCLLLNAKGHVTDSTIANIFLVREKLLLTPALGQGCVAGVMRRYLLEKLSASSNFEVREAVVTLKDLETCEELFLTNAVQGLRWVKRFRKKTYTNNQSRLIHSDCIAPLFS